MSRLPIALEHLQVASPCNAAWDDMTGDDRVRFCGQCKLKVYNLSEVTRPEAEALVGEAGGRLCVRLYRRADGTVLTRDCPVGLRAFRRRLARVAAGVAAVLALVIGAGGLLGAGRGSRTRLRDLEPFSRLTNRLAPPGVTNGTFAIMGEIACPPPAAGGSTPPIQIELGRLAAPDHQNGR